MFQLLLSPATTTPLANGPSWHHRLNVGSANLRPAQFRADLAWHSRRVVSPHELWRRVLSVHRPSVVCRLSPTGTSAWLPFDNTTDADPPRFFNWKSLHLTNYPASDVLCRRTDTVGKTSGFFHRLLESRISPATFVTNALRNRIHPCDQNPAGAERFKNSTAHGSERLPSYSELAKRFLESRRFHSVIHSK